MKPLPSSSVRRLLPHFAAITVFALPAWGQTWTRVRTEASADLTSVNFADAQHGYIAGSLGALLKTSDGGDTWTTVPTPVNFSFMSVAARSGEEVFTARSGLYHTADSGGHWDTDVGGFEPFFGSILDMLFISPTKGFLTKDGFIFASGNGGTEWEQVANTGLFLDDLHYAGGQTLFATGGITYEVVSRGEMARSKDGGLTWETIPAQQPPINDIYAAVWENDQKGIVFTFTNKAHFTANGGDTWEILTDEMKDTEGQRIPSLIMDAVIDDAGHIVAVDFDGNFLDSTDGAEWQVTKGSGEPFTALTKLPDGTLIAVGNSGNIWKRPAADPPPLPLAIESFTFDPDKHSVTLDVTGTPGRDYVVEVSTDLAAWEAIQTTTAPGSKFSIKVDAPRDATTAYFRVAESRRPPPPAEVSP